MREMEFRGEQGAFPSTTSERGERGEDCIYFGAFGDNLSTVDKPSDLTPFQRFDTLMRHVVSVPKAELDKRAEEYKKRREERKSDKKP